MDELTTIHLAQPFKPFVIHLANGRSLSVNHPEFLARSPVGRTAIVFGKRGGFEVVDVMLISGVEVPKENGRRRKQR